MQYLGHQPSTIASVLWFLLTRKSAFKTAQLKDNIGTIKEQAVLTRDRHGMLIYSVVAQVNTNISIQDTITPRKDVRAIPPELEDKDGSLEPLGLNEPLHHRKQPA